MVVDGSVPVPELALVSDDDGVFRLGLPSGEFELEARSAARTGRALVQGDDAEDIVIVLEGDGGSPPG